MNENAVKELIERLEDVANARMIWNGGIAPPRREALQDHIRFMQEDLHAVIPSVRSALASQSEEIERLTRERDEAIAARVLIEREVKRLGDLYEEAANGRHDAEAEIERLKEQVEFERRTWRKEQEIAQKAEGELFQANMKLVELEAEIERLSLKLKAEGRFPWNGKYAPRASDEQPKAEDQGGGPK